ncbi:hypothetical protein Peur_021168 [Populus x canadensis]
MDFSPLSDASASTSYEKIADICDELMLKAAAELEEAPLPFAIHLLSHIYANVTAQDFCGNQYRQR